MCHICLLHYNFNDFKLGVLLAMADLTADALLGSVTEDINLGPFSVPITSVLTVAPLTVGAPTEMSGPSTTSRTLSRFTWAPASTTRRSTSIMEPSTALYCLPPASRIAYFI